MRIAVRGKVGAGFLLGLILLVSFGLRVWGSGFGLPAYMRYHPDEHALVERAAPILWTGDWNLHRFNYPPFYAYLQAVAYASYFLWGAAHGNWNEVPTAVMPQYYQVGRLLTAMAGVSTALVVYLVGRRLGGRRMGLLAAALLSGCFLHVVHSHYATFDVMLGLLVALTLYASLRVGTGQGLTWSVLAGLFAGLAGATKYNGAVALTMPMVAHILTASWGEWGWLNSRFFAIVLGFLLGFFAGNPFALGNLPEFLGGLAVVLHHYGTEQPGFEGTGNWRWYVRVFLTSPDALWVAVGGLGLAGLGWRERKNGLVLVSFPVVYFLIVSGFKVRFERNMVPLLPFLALGGAWLIEAAAVRLSKRAAAGKQRASGFAILGVALVLSIPLAASVAFDLAISRTDLREVAGTWVENNIPPGSKVAIEHYSIPIDRSQLAVEDVIRISDHNLAWYLQEGFDTLVISDGVWELLKREPGRYEERVKAYDELVDGSELLAEFVPRPPRLVVAGYPTVAIYHFAPVRIYGLPR